MINPINFINFTPRNYNVNFRGNSENQNGLNFHVNLRPQLMTDVFEKASSGGIVSTKNTAEKISKLLPENEVKAFVPSKRETERNKIIEKEKEHIAKTVTKRTEESKRKLRAAGVSERDLNKYLTIDGHINSNGQRIIRGN